MINIIIYLKEILELLIPKIIFFIALFFIIKYAIISAIKKYK